VRGGAGDTVRCMTDPSADPTLHALTETQERLLDDRFAVQCARFVAQCQARGIEPEDLDDLVHDVSDHEAAERYNNGEGEDTGDALDDAGALHDLLSQSASEINNGGLADQVPLLLHALGAEALQDELDRIVSGE
jgi:hypothetical protein